MKFRKVEYILTPTVEVSGRPHPTFLTRDCWISFCPSVRITSVRSARSFKCSSWADRGSVYKWRVSTIGWKCKQRVYTFTVPYSFITKLCEHSNHPHKIFILRLNRCFLELTSTIQIGLRPSSIYLTFCRSFALCHRILITRVYPCGSLQVFTSRDCGSFNYGWVSTVR